MNAQRPIRLLWLIDSLTVGGAENLVIPFERSIDRSRIELSICCLATIGGNAIEEQLRTGGAPLLNLAARSLRDAGAFRRLLRFVRQKQFDVIHAHLTYAAIWAAVISRITGIPSVATLHVAPPTSGRAAIRDRLMRLVLNRWSRRVVAVSDALRERYLEQGGFDPEKVVTVYNGIEVGRFRGDANRQALRAEFDLPPESRVVVTVSVLRPGKGIDVLLSAISSIVERVPDAYFLIVGDGPLKAEWEDLARSSGVADRVRWAGYRRDVEAILPGCDLFVLPSLEDAFPTVLLEAMAAGLPAVASATGGIPEIVTPDVTGLLVPPGSPEPLAAAISDLLLDPTRIARMRRCSQLMVEERFSTKAWIGRLEQLYSESVAS
ncbi:MAG: glycosyltransferase [Acidobacteriota bacterium]|nr:glycosyltransferase [Acidobacteriota bacterium]